MENKTVVFVYGTLKRGFGNFWLTSEMAEGGHAEYLGIGRTKSKYPLVCGPFMVPFLIHMEGQGEQVWGEIYAVDEVALNRFDDLEGIQKNHYVRRPVTFTMMLVDDGGESVEVDVQGQAYFAHENYAARLWMKTRNRCLSCYSVSETKNYVRRMDRPKQFSFLEHVENFINDRMPSLAAAASSDSRASVVPVYS